MRNEECSKDVRRVFKGCSKDVEGYRMIDTRGSVGENEHEREIGHEDEGERYGTAQDSKSKSGRRWKRHNTKCT